MHVLADAFLALAFSPLIWTQQISLTSPGVEEISRVHQITRRIITPELGAFVEEIVDKNKIPGLSLGVVHGTGYISEAGAWGQRTEDGAAVTSDTLFFLASCSKAFLSGSVGILMDDYAHGRNKTPLPPGLTRFDWYTKVKDILPDDWKLMDEWATEKATMRDILSHQSGLPRHDMSYTLNDTSLSVIRRMRYLRPAFELRQRYHYNNQMYMLGSYIVTKYAGMPYPEFVKTRIWDPLNMSDTTLYESEASRHGKLSQVWASNGRRIPIWMLDEQISLNAGAGGVISSAVDMIKWLRTLLNAGVDPMTNKTIIPKSVYDMVTTAQIHADSRGPWAEFSFAAYGMGWRRLSYQGHEIVYHGGSIPGFSISTFFLPSDNLGIVALANGDSVHSSEEAIIYRIIEDYLGLERKHSSRLLAKDSNPRTNVTVSNYRQPEPEIVHRQNRASMCPPAPLNLEDYAGIYLNAGYPTITLCAPTSKTAECRQTLEQFALFEDVQRSQTIYAIIPSIWISHGRLHHLEENRFYLTGTYLFPRGYGKDQTPFEMADNDNPSLIVEFVLDQDFREASKVTGVGLRGLVGETTIQEREGGTIEETAEVYFVKA